MDSDTELELALPEVGPESPYSDDGEMTGGLVAPSVSGQGHLAGEHDDQAQVLETGKPTLEAVPQQPSTSSSAT